MMPQCLIQKNICFRFFYCGCLLEHLERIPTGCILPFLRNGFLSGSADTNTEIFSEVLTINLLKLERVGLSVCCMENTKHTYSFAMIPINTHSHHISCQFVDFKCNFQLKTFTDLRFWKFCKKEKQTRGSAVDLLMRNHVDDGCMFCYLHECLYL